MSRSPKAIPAYRFHRQSGQAVVTVRTPDGRRKDITLGRYGTPESKAAYQQVLADLSAGAATGRSESAADLTVNELLVRFWAHAESHYRRADGTPTHELEEYRQSFRPLKELFGYAAAGLFGPRALKAVREQMIAAGWCRSVVNRRVGRVRRAFKWAVGEELVPAAVHQALTAVSGLQAGRSAAPDRKAVRPVSDATVAATLPFLNRHVAGMVRVQRLTGCRPGEVCLLRMADIDTAGPVWVFRPPHHKLAYRNRERLIVIGPAAQKILRDFQTANAADYLFCPRRAVHELHAGRAARRKTPRYPSHVRRNATKRTADPLRPPAECYDAQACGRAVTRAVERANKRRMALAGGADFDPLPHWHPNQLRHTHGTAVRQRYGLEAAQVVLGHARADVTQVYAEADLTLAARVAAEVG